MDIQTKSHQTEDSLIVIFQTQEHDCITYISQSASIARVNGEISLVWNQPEMQTTFLARTQEEVDLLADAVRAAGNLYTKLCERAGEVAAGMN